MTQSNIHTQKFKLLNVELQSGRIDLSHNAWIEIDPNMSQIEISERFMNWMFDIEGRHTDDPGWGILRWFKELFASDIVIGTTHTEEQANTTWLEHEECPHIAIALSIFSDHWFVAGLEYNTNNQETTDVPTPCATTFNGISNGKIIIQGTDVPTLKAVYDFVYGAFRSSTQDKQKQQLLALFIQAIVKTSPESIYALNSGFSTALSGDNRAIIHGNMFFELVFTTESWPEEMKKGVKHWNETFPSAEITWEEIKVIQKRRATFVHGNATKAHKYVLNWHDQHNKTDPILTQALNKLIVKNAKRIMRTIALDYKTYLQYRQSLDQLLSRPPRSKIQRFMKCLRQLFIA